MCKCCVGVDMCAYMQVPEEARGVRSPWAWVTGCCEPRDIRVGPLWEQHMFLTSELSVQLPHSHTSWQSPDLTDGCQCSQRGEVSHAIQDLSLHPMTFLWYLTIPQASLWRKIKALGYAIILHSAVEQTGSPNWVQWLLMQGRLSTVDFAFRRGDSLLISPVCHLLSLLSPYLWLGVLICKKESQCLRHMNYGNSLCEVPGVRPGKC